MRLIHSTFIFALISLIATALPTLGKTIPTMKRADEMQLDAVNLTARSIPAAITQARPSATAVPTSSATTLVDASRKGSISNIIANAAANAITATVEDSMDDDGEGEDDDSEDAEDEKYEDEKKRSSILSDVPADVILDIGPILGDDLLSGALVSEEPNDVNGAVDGQPAEASKRDKKGEKANPIRGNGQAGAEGIVGRRRAKYNGAPGQSVR